MPVGGLAPPPLEEEERREVESGQGVIFILDGAQLETAQVGKSYQLLNCDDHAGYLKKHSKDPSLFRPDIAHQALMMILDSPLNKAGKLKALYVHTSKNVLIQINPKVRLPRTFKRFCGLMVQLLQKLSIRATNGPDKLMRIIKGPVTRHLPAGARRVGFSHSSDTLVTIASWGAGLKDADLQNPIVFVVGGFAHGTIDQSYVDEFLSVSQFPLSAAYAISRITNAMEARWGIV
ncbi:MAG: pre-rRNA processing protein [Monoraphidium minutum]|nr:MAG: pre-rRNA processing protein [Monoraphidium minutum]